MQPARPWRESPATAAHSGYMPSSNSVGSPSVSRTGTLACVPLDYRAVGVFSCYGVTLKVLMRCRGRFGRGWSDANGKIAAGKDGFGRRLGFDLSHAERMLDDCRKAHPLRFRFFAEGWTVRQGHQGHQGHQGQYASTRQIEFEAWRFPLLIRRLVRHQLPARSLVSDNAIISNIAQRLSRVTDHSV